MAQTSNRDACSTLCLETEKTDAFVLTFPLNWYATELFGKQPIHGALSFEPEWGVCISARNMFVPAEIIPYYNDSFA